MHSPVEMVQLDDVENTAKLIAAFAQKLEPATSTSSAETPAPPALGHRRHAAAARDGRARAGAARGGRARCTGSSASTACRSRTPGGPTRRSRATCCAAPAWTTPRSTRARTTCSRAPSRPTRELCPADLSRVRRPRRAGGARRARRRRGASTGRRCVTGNLEPIAPAQARARRDRRLLRGRARAASAPTPRTARELPAIARGAGRRLAARAHGRDRRHAARHRLRARRRVRVDRGRDRAVRRRGRWPTRTPSWTTPAPCCRCWRTGPLRPDHLGGAAAAADGLGRREHAARRAGTRSRSPRRSRAGGADVCAFARTPCLYAHRASAAPASVGERRLGLARRPGCAGSRAASRSPAAACVPRSIRSSRICSTVVMIVAPPGEPSASNGRAVALDDRRGDRASAAACRRRARSGRSGRS